MDAIDSIDTACPDGWFAAKRRSVEDYSERVSKKIHESLLTRSERSVRLARRTRAGKADNTAFYFLIFSSIVEVGLVLFVTVDQLEEGKAGRAFVTTDDGKENDDWTGGFRRCLCCHQLAECGTPPLARCCPSP